LVAHLADTNSCFKTHYAQDHLKRVLFILPEEGWQDLEKMINKDIESISENAIKIGGEPLNKVFFIKDYAQFQKKYSLLCIPSGQVSDRDQVCALSRFPTEIKKDYLYVGNITNALEKDNRQLRMLNVKSIVYLSSDRFDDLDK